MYLRLDVVAEVATSHDGTCPHDCLKELVVGTSSLVHADLFKNMHFKTTNYELKATTENENVFEQISFSCNIVKWFEFRFSTIHQGVN